MEHHTPSGDLEGVGNVVTEGHHFLALVAFAFLEMDTQVAPGSDVIGKIIQPRNLASEATVAALVLSVHVGDEAVEADGLPTPWYGGQGPGC